MSAHSSVFANLRARLAARRAVRRDQLALERYLAECSSPTARQELTLILTRHEAAATPTPSQLVAARSGVSRKVRQRLIHAGL